MKRTTITAAISSLAILSACSQPGQDVWQAGADATDQERQIALESAQPIEIQAGTSGTYSFASKIISTMVRPVSGSQSLTVEVRDDTLYILDQQPLREGVAVLGVQLEDGSTYVAGNPAVFATDR